MSKTGQLSKTARLSLAKRTLKDHLTDHRDPMSGEYILLSHLLPVKVLRNGKTSMVYYDKNGYQIPYQRVWLEEER